MMRRLHASTLRGTWILPVLLLWAVCGTVRSEDPAPSLMERVHAESKKVRVWYQNAAHRLRNNFQSLDLGDEESQAPPTALRKCCSRNIEKMEKAIKTLGELFVELDSCYDGAGNSDGIIALEFVKADLAEFAWAWNELAKVSGHDAATKSLSAVTLTFIKYRDSVDKLPPCPAEAKAREGAEEKNE